MTLLPGAEAELRPQRSPAAVVADAGSFDEALRAGLVALCHQRPTVLAHAVRAAEPREPLRPLGMLCGDKSLDHAFLGNALFRLVPPGTGLTRAAVHVRGPVWIPSIAESAGFLRKDLLAHHGVRSGAGIPVVVGSKVAAVIEVLCFEELDEHAGIASHAACLSAELRGAAAQFWSL